MKHLKLFENYFDGISDKEEIKKRYRKLANKLHPDKGGDTEEFKKMQSDYESTLKKSTEKTSVSDTIFKNTDDIFLSKIFNKIVGNKSGYTKDIFTSKYSKTKKTMEIKKDNKRILIINMFLDKNDLFTMANGSGFNYSANDSYSMNLKDLLSIAKKVI
jgi:DnaJ-class molecular chaperone